MKNVVYDKGDDGHLIKVCHQILQGYKINRKVLNERKVKQQI